MTSAKRIPLNPCDYLYFAHHRLMQQTVCSGNIAFMMLEVEGHPPPDRIQRSLTAAMLAHPIIVARLRTSLTTGRPYWKLPRSLPQAARLAARKAHTHEDLTHVEDWKVRLDRLCRLRYGPDWDLAAGPQVRLEQYALPNGLTRFCIRWPHLMMDAEGAQLFLAEMGRLHEADPDHELHRRADLPPEVSPDHDTIDVMAEHSFSRRLSFFRRAFSIRNELKHLKIRALIRDSKQKLTDFGLIHRNWDPDQVRIIQAKAKSWMPPGPALYARYLAACVILALHRIHTETGTDTDAYLITLPLRVTMRDRQGNTRKKRPIPGNYLVSPTISARKHRADDKRAVGEDIQQQLEAYHRAQVDLTQWVLVWMASFMRASWYPLLFRLPLGFESLSSGFSYYGESVRPVRSFGGHTVANLWGGGPLATPPGWNPVFSKFRDRLNFSLTWNRPAVPDELARRYVDLIEEEIFEPPG